MVGKRKNKEIIGGNFGITLGPIRVGAEASFGNKKVVNMPRRKRRRRRK